MKKIIISIIFFITILLFFTCCGSESGNKEYYFHVEDIISSDEGYYFIKNSYYSADSLSRTEQLFKVNIKNVKKETPLLGRYKYKVKRGNITFVNTKIYVYDLIEEKYILSDEF